MTNRYYIVEELTETVLQNAVSLKACAIIVGIPESLRELAVTEDWILPHLWIEEIPELNIGPDDVT